MASFGVPVIYCPCIEYHGAVTRHRPHRAAPGSPTTEVGSTGWAEGDRKYTLSVTYTVVLKALSDHGSMSED